MSDNIEPVGGKQRQADSRWVTFTLRVKVHNSASINEAEEEIVGRLDDGGYETGPLVDALTPSGREEE